jgi:hypothetical protein
VIASTIIRLRLDREGVLEVEEEEWIKKVV